MCKQIVRGKNKLQRRKRDIFKKMIYECLAVHDNM